MKQRIHIAITLILCLSYSVTAVDFEKEKGGVSAGVFDRRRGRHPLQHQRHRRRAGRIVITVLSGSAWRRISADCPTICHSERREESRFSCSVRSWTPLGVCDLTIR